MAAGVETEVHLHGRACRPSRSPAPNRVHTSFALAATTTGRLSSSDPNVQNIPIRTEAGSEDPNGLRGRAGPQARIGRLLADRAAIAGPYRGYSAAETGFRRRARHSRDHGLRDVRRAASTTMTGEVRRRAKAINFGIIYGISAFGLANQLGIPRSEAGDYIKTYFERFPGIRDYMDATKKLAKQQGYVTTLFGRKVPLSAHHGVEPLRAGLQRAGRHQHAHPGLGRRHHPARHDPHGRRPLTAERLQARMLLQVHDELVFEVPNDEIARAIIGHQARDDRRTASGRGAIGAARRRRGRRGQLGRGALKPAKRAAPASVSVRHVESCESRVVREEAGVLLAQAELLRRRSCST